MSKRKRSGDGLWPEKKVKNEENKSGCRSLGRTQISIVSWNINGFRAWIQKPSVLQFCKKQDFDILCFSETKLQDSHVADAKKIFPQHPFQLWSCSQGKKGYSGTAVLSKIRPIRFTEGINIKKHDDEGRTITAEFDSFFLVSTYVPNAGKRLERLKYRTKEWDVDLRNYLKTLERSGKGVVWIGDLNVVHEDIDIYNMIGKEKLAGCTKEERKGFDVSLREGFVDSFRLLYPDEGKYTWYSGIRSRSENWGWRVDYAVISQDLVPKLIDSRIYDDVEGSDHYPIELVISN